MGSFNKDDYKDEDCKALNISLFVRFYLREYQSFVLFLITSIIFNNQLGHHFGFYPFLALEDFLLKAVGVMATCENPLNQKYKKGLLILIIFCTFIDMDFFETFYSFKLFYQRNITQ